MNFFDLIKVNYDKLTFSEKKISDFLITNPEKFLNLNSNEIANMAESSSSTVVRFSKKLGFESLEKLKIQLAQDCEQKKDVILNPILSETDSTQDVVKKIYSNFDTSLKKTLQLINIDDVKYILKLTRRADNIYLYGIGASSLSAYDLYHKFNRVNKKTFYNFDANMNLEFSVHTRSDDLVIAFSYSGDSKEVLLSVEQAKKNGTPVIAIVQEGITKLSQLADYCLFIPKTEAKLRMGSISSKISQLFFVDLLYLGSIQNDLELVINNLKLTANAVMPLKS